MEKETNVAVYYENQAVHFFQFPFRFCTCLGRMKSRQIEIQAAVKRHHIVVNNYKLKILSITSELGRSSRKIHTKKKNNTLSRCMKDNLKAFLTFFPYKITGSIYGIA